MPPRVLLVNPPIYDFAAYDFWLKPYGLLRVGGRLRGRAELALFDFLDRLAAPGRQDSDAWGRGHYPRQIVQKPPFLPVLRRRFSRYGLPRALFQRFLAEQPPFDAALINGGMTYWYPGVREVD